MRTVPEVSLTIAGEMSGPVRRVVATLASDPSLAGRVEIREGYVPADGLAALLADHDVLALPYRSATASQNVVLGHAHGLPVLASDVVPFSQQVVDGVNGLLVPPDDERALAGALRRLRDPELRRRLADGVQTPDLSAPWAHYLGTIEALSLDESLLGRAAGAVADRTLRHSRRRAGVCRDRVRVSASSSDAGARRRPRRRGRPRLTCRPSSVRVGLGAPAPHATACGSRFIATCSTCAPRTCLTGCSPPTCSETPPRPTTPTDSRASSVCRDRSTGSRRGPRSAHSPPSCGCATTAGAAPHRRRDGLALAPVPLGEGGRLRAGRDRVHGRAARASPHSMSTPARSTSSCASTRGAATPVTHPGARAGLVGAALRWPAHRHRPHRPPVRRGAVGPADVRGILAGPTTSASCSSVTSTATSPRACAKPSVGREPTTRHTASSA